ncbi:Integrase catalytic domain-containing protein [Aphis craccivora]|uniref:Integrase catalytic domain-containing protein n=1 Tax=Aphis craccivora TaxID=307492 RepID=A0A6G0XET1_APHCR|nr:Integrase catalytic domain-containing protein [Aphis craccivora]
MTGCDTEAECCRLQQEVSMILNLLNSAKLPLRKWCSNSQAVLQYINKEEQDPLFTLNINDDDTVKSLGLCWKPIADEFHFQITHVPENCKLTKRTMLSQLNRIFDPLGFLAPVLVKGKIFLKQLWQLKIDWDTSLQEDLKKNEAYGACIYVRSLGHYGIWHSQLLCSKTRVTPLKGITIPRLELNGAHLLVQLVVKTSDAWKTYVSNRVTQILEVSSPSQWRHVRTNQIPADIISRGISAQELSTSTIWWRGPCWLSQSPDCWNSPPMQPILMDELPEQRPLYLSLLATIPLKDFVSSYSSWPRLVRAVGWILKFIEYIGSRREKPTANYLTIHNLRAAQRALHQTAQEETFGKEIAALIQCKNVPYHSKLRSLNPLLIYKLLVVGGRLEYAMIPEEQRTPIILPAYHRITRLIFTEHHRTLLADIRRQYWPVRGRLTARSVVKRCVDCIRAKPKFQHPLMVTLPKERVTSTRPFTNTGVDFAGPLIIRSGIRGIPGKKAWIAIFVCFSNKAAHIEAVEDLTSNAFIASLRRFCSRRGKPDKIWSDNAAEGINWHFNPPSTPHFGGIWESCLKSAKDHLSRIVKDAHLTLSELQTLLCQIEACINYRPLSPLSSSPDDLEPLTPAHFLIGGPITLPPEPDLTSQQLSGIRRWTLEYLPQLQIRGKWTTATKPLAIGDVVIVKEDNMPPCKWKMARITCLHPGRDGHIRVVTTRTANGTEMKRPALKLCQLPVEEESEDF